MKQTLDARLGQQTAMTAELRHSLWILQLSTSELKTVIEKEYEENPVLEIDYAPPDEDAPYPRPAFGDTAPLQPARLPTLEETLRQQIRLAFPDPCERRIACFLAGSLSPDGYLSLSVEEAARHLNAREPAVSDVLARVQRLAPAGVAARGLAECLRLQAERKHIYTGLVAALIDRHLEALAAGNLRRIASAESCTEADVRDAARVLRTLHPRPGIVYDGEAVSYPVPDARVVPSESGYRLCLCEAGFPRLTIGDAYRRAADFDGAARAYVRERLHAARRLIRSVDRRRRTVRRVLEEIIRRQPDCLRAGLSALRPLTLKTVAQALGLHEATVSRAVAQKTIAFPWGVVAMRQLFSSHIESACGAPVSAQQAMHAIRRLLANEDPARPLSDRAIALRLAEQGILIARRTVMKYRERLGLLSSRYRKR